MFLEQIVYTAFKALFSNPVPEGYISGHGVPTNELNQLCLIRKSLKMCSVGLLPGTGLGNTDLRDANNTDLLKIYYAKCQAILNQRNVSDVTIWSKRH